jgi:hypothetical protein
MSSPALETFLARLYTDRPFLERFLTDPAGTMSEAGLTGDEQRCLADMDRGGLLLAVRSFERKRAARGWPSGARPQASGTTLAARLRAWLRWVSGRPAEP